MKLKLEKLKALGNKPDHKEIEEILKISPRAEKIAVKDLKTENIHYF